MTGYWPEPGGDQTVLTPRFGSFMTILLFFLMMFMAKTKIAASCHPHTNTLPQPRQQHALPFSKKKKNERKRNTLFALEMFFWFFF